MKHFFFVITILFVFQTQAQFNPTSPWMLELKDESPKKEFTLAEISNAFETYWELHKTEKIKKGSGYKPFKRWQSRWKNSLDSNGKVITSKELWKAWEDKNNLQTRGTNDFSNWQNIGPFTQNSKSGQGRVNAIAVDPNNPNTYYVGAPAGGIWKSTDAGVNWIPLSDYLPQIGVSGIAIDPTNSDIIYIATGDDDANDSYSIGVLKSIDGGVTWQTTGLQFNNTSSESNEIYIHPTRTNILWVATSNGVYKTTDSGLTWSLKLNGYIRDLKIKPSNPNIIYAVSSSVFYKSTDGGENFIQITIGLPLISNRLAIDVTPANSNLVYLLSANSSNGFQGIYKSTNSGDSFVRTAENSDIFGSTQSWYDMALTVSDTNENNLFVGVLNLWRSTDGGDGFTKLNDWYNPSGASYTHADIHFLRYFNGNLFCGSDGGIYKSTNDGSNFNELNEGLSISQYYRIAVSKQTASNIAGGLQDNGGFAYSNNTWYKYHGGDGMDCAVDPNNPSIYYGFSQFGGSLNVTYNGGVFGQGVASAPESGNWITPMAINSQGVVYGGFSHLYKINNGSWQQVSGNNFGGKLNHIEIDPMNESTIYVSKSNRLYKSTDSGVTFTQIYTTNSSITSIEVNNDTNSILYLTISGVGGQVLKSINSGATFTNITGNLPIEPKNIIKHQPHTATNDLYVGTSLGVYHTNDTMTNWEVFSTNLPNVPVRDLEINVNDRILTAGTYGRGVWQTAIEVSLPNNDVSILSIDNAVYTCDTNITPSITIKNEGLNTINQVSINYSVDNTNYTHTFNGNINSNDTQLVSLPNITGLSLGEHQLTIETTITNDAYSDNNNLITSFFVNSMDNNPTIINPFNTSGDNWLRTGTNLWNIDTPTTALLGTTNSTGYITNASGNYPNNSSAYLVSPCYDLSQLTNPILKFDMAFDIEIDWDVLYVEYTTNNGNTWEVLGTANDPNWYNNTYDAHALTIGKQWSGTDTTLKEYSYNLQALTNENNISFRFAFLTDQAVTNEGVLIDNFVITGTTASITDNTIFDLVIYPNPSKSIFTINRNSKDTMKITVFDITGKKLVTKNGITNSRYNLDLSLLEKGVYFASIKINTKVVTKKIILN